MLQTMVGNIVDIGDKYILASGFKIDISKFGKVDYVPFCNGCVKLHYGNQLKKMMKIYTSTPSEYFRSSIGKQAEFQIQTTRNTKTYRGKTTSAVEAHILSMYIIE